MLGLLVQLELLRSGSCLVPSTRSCSVPATNIGAHLVLGDRVNHLLVEMLQENEASGGAYDGGQATNGGSVRYAQREALADHLVMVGSVLLLVQFLVLGAGGRDSRFFLPKESQGIPQSAWAVLH